jgi:SAM-dependent methyltransferase
VPRYRNPNVLACSAFQLFLHDELRSRELERAPEGARTVLHGGAAGRWSFDWFESCYPTEVERHIGVEAFLPEPEDLADNVQWLPRTLGDLEPVGDGEVDLVYAGEVIEHLWPEDVVGFLLESNRVLRRGGAVALDSPNREVTGLAGWEHAEHTVEVTPQEIRDLLRLAGVDQVVVRGIWLAYDRAEGRVLELETLEPEGEWTVDRRREEAADRPDDSFLWWAEGRKGDRAPDRKRIAQLVDEAYRVYRGRRFARFHSHVGEVTDGVVTTSAGETGHLVFGPYVPVRGGRWTARFEAGLVPGAAPLAPEESMGTVDVTKELDVQVVASRELLAGELPDEGLAEVEVPFELPRTETGVQLRCSPTGGQVSGRGSVPRFTSRPTYNRPT